MHTKRRLPNILGILTILVVVACGGGTVASSGPGGPGTTSDTATTQSPGGGTQTQAPGGGEAVDACALLTEADIEAVTGNATESSVAGWQFGIFASGCEWKLVDTDAIVPPTIALGVMKPGGKGYYEKHFAPFNAENGYEAIEGLGDEAVDADGSALVVTGDAFFNLQYLGGGFGGDDTGLATELARRVVANLGGS